jgi:hypothetical protein
MSRFPAVESALWPGRKTNSEQSGISYQPEKKLAALFRELNAES